MLKLLRNKILLSMFMMLLSISGFGQFSQHPPEPNMAAQSNDEAPYCDGNDYDYDPNTPEPPPPPGLPCLPIDDYIIPLLLIGVIYGVYKIKRLEQV